MESEFITLTDLNKKFENLDFKLDFKVQPGDVRPPELPQKIGGALATMLGPLSYLLRIRYSFIVSISGNFEGFKTGASYPGHSKFS